MFFFVFFSLFFSLSLFTPLGLGWLWHLSSCPVWFGLVVGGCAVGLGTLYLQPVPALAWFSCLWQVQHYMPCFFNASLDYIHTSIVKQVREEGRRKKEREKNAYMYIRHTQGKRDVSMGAWTLHWAGSTLHVMLF